MPKLTRRAFLAGSATSAAAIGATGGGDAAVLPVARQGAGLYRYRIGGLVLTAIHDGVWNRPIDAAFVPNAAFSDVQQAMRDAFMPALDIVPLPITTLLVDTGKARVLIDTGTGGQIGPSAGALLANLGHAGITPKEIDAVVISHFHFDHIDGLVTKDGAPVFPIAEIHIPSPEWAFWMEDANLRAAPPEKKREFLNARRVLGNMTKHLRHYDPGQDVLPGITSIAAFGHTPGHAVFAVASGSDSVLVLGDTTDHPALFVRHPEWQPTNDLDGPAAAATRRKLLDRAAADRMLVQGYHFPFPGVGHIVKDGAGFVFVPSQWQQL